MAEIVLTTEVLMAAAFAALAAVLYLRDGPLFAVQRDYSMNPTLSTIDHMEPDDVVIMEVPEATDEEAATIRKNMEDVGIVNAVVVNRELTDVKLGDIHIGKDEVVDPR